MNIPTLEVIKQGIVKRVQHFGTQKAWYYEYPQDFLYNYLLSFAASRRCSVDGYADLTSSRTIQAEYVRSFDATSLVVTQALLGAMLERVYPGVELHWGDLREDKAARRLLARINQVPQEYRKDFVRQVIAIQGRDSGVLLVGNTTQFDPLHRAQPSGRAYRYEPLDDWLHHDNLVEIDFWEAFAVHYYAAIAQSALADTSKLPIDSAIEVLEQAASINSRMFIIKDVWARLLDKKGDKNGAREMLQAQNGIRPTINNLAQLVAWKVYTDKEAREILFDKWDYPAILKLAGEAQAVS